MPHTLVVVYCIVMCHLILPDSLAMGDFISRLAVCDPAGTVNLFAGAAMDAPMMKIPEMGQVCVSNF